MVNNITINLTKKYLCPATSFPKYIIPSAKEVLEHSLKIVKKNKKRKKFTFIHLMDAHHSESPGRIIHTLIYFQIYS